MARFARQPLIGAFKATAPVSVEQIGEALREAEIDGFSKVKYCEDGVVFVRVSVPYGTTTDEELQEALLTTPGAQPYAL